MYLAQLPELPTQHKIPLQVPIFYFIFMSNFLNKIDSFKTSFKEKILRKFSKIVSKIDITSTCLNFQKANFNNCPLKDNKLDGYRL